MVSEQFPSPNAIPPRTSSSGLSTTLSTSSNHARPQSPTKPVLVPVPEGNWIAGSRKLHTTSASLDITSSRPLGKTDGVAKVSEREWSHDKERILLGPFDYMYEHPGKNIRKSLIRTFNAWMNVPEESLAIITKVVGMLHTASLLVDDVEDSSLLRRGIPVAHSIFGTAQTINSANYVYFLALQELVKLNNTEVVQIYTDELINLHRGQGMDLFWRDTLTCPNEEDYLEMVGNKTGGLFRLAVKLMQAESNNEIDYVPLVNLIGALFQIRDDYLNLCSTEYTSNKGLCEDLTEGKFSFPIIHSIRSNPSNLQLINILKQKTNDEEVKRYAVAYMKSTGSFEYCRKTLEDLTLKARAMLDSMDGGSGAGDGHVLADIVSGEINSQKCIEFSRACLHNEKYLAPWNANDLHKSTNKFFQQSTFFSNTLIIEFSNSAVLEMAAPFLAFWQASQSKTELADRSAGVPLTGDSSTTSNDPLDPSGEFHTHKRSRKHKSRKSHASPPQTPVLLDSDEFNELDDFSLTLDGHVQQKQPKLQKSMSLNGTGNMFPSFLDTNTGSGPNSNMQRTSPLGAPQQQHQVNGTGGGMNGMGSGMNNGMSGLPMNAGQQMDVNMLYQKVLELSDVLRDNRERTHGIVAGAEELATRAAANGASPSLQEANAEISAARIADLERQLAREQNKTRTILREQKENTKLIGEYETAVGNIVEMVRNYSFNNKAEKTSLQLHYNKLLQEEKDAHLEARLEKDHWHSKFLRSVEMLRDAYRLRCEEEEVPTRVVAGLQNEVRAYRNALGMERERPEDEFGWEVLKDVADRED